MLPAAQPVSLALRPSEQTEHKPEHPNAAEHTHWVHLTGAKAFRDTFRRDSKFPPFLVMLIWCNISPCAYLISVAYKKFHFTFCARLDSAGLCTPGRQRGESSRPKRIKTLTCGAQQVMGTLYPGSLFPYHYSGEGSYVHPRRPWRRGFENGGLKDFNDGGGSSWPLVC